MISDIEQTFASGPEKAIDAFTADEIDEIETWASKQVELLEDGTVQEHWTDGNGLAVSYTVTPGEAADRKEDGYSLGHPGSAPECEVHGVSFGGQDIGDMINALEAASGAVIWEGLQERMLERGQS